MYKLLLSWRYLRTRYIALASIISVTLGVATLIVVNSVMAGFSQEMHQRLHGILSDLVFESHNLDGFPDPEWHMDEIRRIVGDDLAGMTPVVHVPALLQMRLRGQYHTRQINLIGIDEATYAQVSDFGQYLLHPANRRQLSFCLREDGYAPGRKDFPPSGWRHRRMRGRPGAGRGRTTGRTGTSAGWPAAGERARPRASGGSPCRRHPASRNPFDARQDPPEARLRRR